MSFTVWTNSIVEQFFVQYEGKIGENILKTGNCCQKSAFLPGLEKCSQKSAKPH